METPLIIKSLFIIDCISCILTLRLCYLAWKQFQHAEIEEFSLQSATENFCTITAVL